MKWFITVAILIMSLASCKKKYCWECHLMVTGKPDEKVQICDKTQSEIEQTGHALREPCKKIK